MPSVPNLARYCRRDLLELFVTNSSRLPAARSAASAWAQQRQQQQGQGSMSLQFLAGYTDSAA